MDKQVVGVLHADRRVARRFPASLVVLLTWEGRLIQAMAEDIAMTGMRLSCECDLEVGTTLKARFATKGDTETHELVGKIVWSRPSNEIAGIYLAGYEFGALPELTLDRLASIIRQVGGEAGADDLPLVEAIDLAAEPAPGAQLPDLDLSTFAPTASAAVPSTAASTSSPGGDPAHLALQIAQAIAQDAQVRAENRRQADAIAGAARTAQESGALAEAARGYRRAIELAPDVAAFYEDLADVLYLGGDTRESARLLDRALRLRMQRK